MKNEKLTQLTNTETCMRKRHEETRMIKRRDEKENKAGKMVKKEEIDKVIEWCEKTKKDRNRIYIIERNPFKDEIEWMRRYALIEIDRPTNVASQMSIVYDSTTKTLHQYQNGSWRKIEKDIKIEK